MDETMAFLMPRGGGGTMLAAVNEHLAVAGLSITREDALMLAERRVESLAETERIEFGPPAVAAIAKAIASSPFLMQDNLVNVLFFGKLNLFKVKHKLQIFTNRHIGIQRRNLGKITDFLLCFFRLFKNFRSVNGNGSVG